MGRPERHHRLTASPRLTSLTDVTHRRLNASCTDNKDCKVSIGSASCVESDEDDRMCACSPGTSVSADGQNCVNVTGLESACSSDDDCNPLGSYVSCYSGSCSCDSNYYKNPSTNAGEPLCLPGIGGKCSKYDCQLDNTSCSSFNVCSCDDSFTPSEKKDRCLKVALEEGDNCTEHTQCSIKLGSSQCVDGSCVCLEHYHYLNGSCWETRTLGESCTSLSECLKESSQNSVECRNNKCQCGFNYKENNNACEYLLYNPLSLSISNKRDLGLNPSHASSVLLPFQLTAFIGVGF
uniref:EB domain-containing protein n=1 Tax=Timema cristinae TaxID=61476 RepID=A0A7R9H6U5_TIMCR|nr:unnamed protein product [Timema cristinae]